MEVVRLSPFTPSTAQMLESHGLPEVKMLEHIGQRMLGAYLDATPHDAANASGSFAYFVGIRAMRDFLIPKGWDLERSNNLELTVNPDTGVAMMVASGDKFTGREGNRSPRTRNDKGSQTAKRVVFNSNQSSFSGEGWDLPLRKTTSEFDTWILLHFVDRKSEEMRLELSLPINIDEYGHVDDWRKRLIIPAISFGSTLPPITPEFAPEAEIIIHRRKTE